MWCTFINFLFISILFINGSYGADNFAIFLQVSHNGTSKDYNSDFDVIYKINETVGFICRVTGDLYNSPGYRLVLKKDGKEDRSTKSDEIDAFFVLKEAHDGMELECVAETTAIKKPLTISAHLKLKTAAFKLNVLFLILIIVGGILILALLISTCYTLIRCIKKKSKKSDEEIQLADISMKTNEIKYAEINLKAKNKVGWKVEDPQYTEIGFINASCDVTDNEHKNDKPTKENEIPNIVIMPKEPIENKDVRKTDANHSQLHAKNRDTINELVTKFNRGSTSEC